MNILLYNIYIIDVYHILFYQIHLLNILKDISSLNIVLNFGYISESQNSIFYI